MLTAGTLDNRGFSRADMNDALPQLQSHRLRVLLEQVKASNPFYQRKYASLGADPATIDWRCLPFTHKAELIADQSEYPPYGSNLTYEARRYIRLHQTSGTSSGRPLRWLDTAESWDWMLGCWSRLFSFLDLQPTDCFFFPFSFGPFLGFWTAFEAATRLGYRCLAGGGMGSTARLRFLLEHRATIICCTPTYALHLAELAAQEQLDLAGSSVRALVLAGEPGACIDSTRQRLESQWGARVFDHYGLTEVGPTAIECRANPGGMHLLEEDYLAEVLAPQGDRPVAVGEVGELVLTNLGRIGSPLIRYRTGDLVRIDPKPCPCGTPWRRFAGGILGRTDDMIHVRGNNVYPSSLEAVIRRFPEIVEYRIIVDQTGPLTDLAIEIEPTPGADRSLLSEAVARAIRDELLFRVAIRTVDPGSLPRFEMKARRIFRKSADD